MHRHEPTTQHGRTTPGNVAHAGCTTATTCTPQHTRSDTHAWACEHARAHTAQLPAAEHDDIVGEHAHQAKKKSDSTCRNAKNLPPKKNSWSIERGSLAGVMRPRCAGAQATVRPP